VLTVREHGLHVSLADLRRQLAYSLPFGLAFAIIIPQQQFHLYFVSANVSAAAFAIYSVGCFQLPLVDMLYTPVSEILQLGIAEHDRAGDRDGPARLFREASARLAFFFVPCVALLYVCGPTLLTFLFTPRYRDSVPIFRLAILAIPLAALPLDGVMRARAQNRFVLAVSVVKLASTVPLVVFGFRSYGLTGAVGGWIAAEALARGILLLRAGRLFGGLRHALPWRTLAFQSAAAALAAPAGLAALRATSALRSTGGQGLVRLILCGSVFALAYLGVLRATGQLPPVRSWIPRKRPAEPTVPLAA
jgi:O-antigen/teichoic acid export membrane protein